MYDYENMGSTSGNRKIVFDVVDRHRNGYILGGDLDPALFRGFPCFI